MHLVDPDLDNLRGQVIYLDFDGAENVTYNGPVTVEDIDIRAFEAPAELTGQEQQIIADVVAQLEATFAEAGLSFTIDKPDSGNAYSTVFVGGDNTAFSEYGDFFGLSETVDIGNQKKDDGAFVFANEFGRFVSTVTAVNALAHIIEHEVGHLLGFAHEKTSPEALGDFAYEGTVYWGARDLVEWPGEYANHHFMVIRFDGAAPSWNDIRTLESGHKAFIVGGQSSDPDNPTTDKLVSDPQNGPDLEATNDVFADNELEPPWDAELESMDIPSGLTFDSFSTVLYELTQIYDNQVPFHLNPAVHPIDPGGNCATYANTMMAKAGVPESEREEKSDFSGIDWGEDMLLPNGHFSYMTGISSSASFVTKGTDFTLTATTKATAALEKVEFYWIPTAMVLLIVILMTK